MFSPSEASFCKFACTRTAGRWPPEILTRPTPYSCEIFWAMRVSDRSTNCVMGKVRDETARVITGASAGLTLA